ncbi:MAG: S41 family peptidase [Xanthomonadales bacterium]|nr:S41 family peptidase [Xanthomonadales bacterium]
MSLTGTWKSQGYGWMLDIGPEGYSLFDIIPGQAVEFERGSTEEFKKGFEVLGGTSNDTLQLRVRNDITSYVFDRVERLPAKTLHLHDPRQPDPIGSFEFFRAVFENDYAFFKHRNVDWPEICAEARSRVSANTSPETLLQILGSLIQPLQDNHVVVSDGQTTLVSERLADVKQLIANELGVIGHIGDPENVASIGRLIQQEFLGSRGRQAGNGSVHWGMMEKNIAYLNVIRMFGLADTEAARVANDLPLRRPDNARFHGDDLMAIDAILDDVMTDIAPADALALDVRLNGGGFDKLGMKIANRLADRRQLAFTKHARRGDGFTEKQPFYIEPEGQKRFSRPVYLLTSARTASAGDVFALCMRALPQVTIVGQPSTGILSDNLRKHLPNGWYTTISNEYYCAADGQLFEGSGVPVDVETPVFVAGDFRAGYHRAVDEAIALAHSKADRASV